MQRLTKTEFEQQFGLFKSKILHLFKGDYCLYYKGDLSVDSIALDYQSPFFEGKNVAGLIVDGNLTVSDNIINGDWDEGPFLVVTGDVKVRNFATSGSEVYIKGSLTAEDLVWTEYNHGSARIGGDLTAKLFICSEHCTTVSGTVNAAFIGENPLGKIKAKKVRDYTDVLVSGLVERSDEDQIIDTQMLLEYITEGKQIVDIAKPVNLLQFEAAKAKDWDTVIKLVKDGSADIHAKNENRQTLLHLAAQKGKTELIELLLAKGADVNLIDKKDNTPLSLAARYSNFATIQLLLENGADAAQPKKKFAPLVCAVEKGNAKTIELLLQHKAYLESKNHSGCTALCIACNQNDIKLAKRLADAGANVNCTDEDGETPLRLAATYGKFDMVKMLLDKGADINQVWCGEAKTALTGAIIGNQFDIVKFLVENGADVNIGGTSILGNTLAVAIDCLSWKKEYDSRIPEYLWDNKGADVRTALYYGTYWDYEAIVKWIHEKGFDVFKEFDFNGLWALSGEVPKTLYDIIRLNWGPAKSKVYKYLDMVKNKNHTV